MGFAALGALGYFVKVSILPTIEMRSCISKGTDALISAYPHSYQQYPRRIRLRETFDLFHFKLTYHFPVKIINK